MLEKGSNRKQISQHKTLLKKIPVSLFCSVSILYFDVNVCPSASS